MKWKGIDGTLYTPATFALHAGTLDFTTWRPEFVVVHNTQIPTLAKWRTMPGKRWMAALESYYRDDQGWSGGPHLFVDDVGIWGFTPLTVPGVHSPSWNDRSWGLEIVGDYETEPLEDTVRENVFDALHVLHRAAGWTSPQIRFHKEDPKTTHDCPGRNIVKAQFVAGVETFLDLDK